MPSFHGVPIGMSGHASMPAAFGRIAAQMSEGEADWEAVAAVVGLRDSMGKATLIVGNGDLFSAGDLDRRGAETGVDGLMVGRGIFRDPWIFRKDRPHVPFRSAPAAVKLDLMERHIREHLRVWDGGRGYEILKAFYKVYSVDFEGAEELKQLLFQTHRWDEALALIAEARGKR